MPAAEVAAWAEETLAWARRQGIRSVDRAARNVLARVKAMAGEFDRARAEIEAVKKITPSSSEPLLSMADEMTETSVDLLEDRPGSAERTLRRTYGELKKEGAKGPLAIVMVMLARALLVQGREDEAERLAKECEEIAPESQRDAQIKHREIRAVVLARRASLLASQGGSGEAAAMAQEAERLALEAVALSDQTEQLDSRAQAHYGLAEVLGRAGRWSEAEAALEQARELWLRKGNLVSADKAPKLLEGLRQAGPTA
jgi:tetratricopeptide (TPR) repeat protein